jgi:hypothetical protein
MTRITTILWFAFFIIGYHQAKANYVPLAADFSLHNTIFFDNNFDNNKEEVSKTISEKYATDKDTKLDIKNRYGKVHINTWTKNEITIDITIKAYGKDKEKAQEILDRIKIKYAKVGNMISYETEIGEEKKSWWGNWDWSFSWSDDDKGFEINYVVNMPIENALSLENKYGAVFLDNFNGELNLEVKYGSLKANKLQGVSKTIELGYSKGEIESIEKGNLEFKYSSGKIDEVGEINLENRYGSFTINKAKKVSMETKYGSFAVKTIDELTGSVGYSGCEIGEIRKKLVMEVRYASGFEVDKIAAGFERVEIEGSYNSIKLGFENKSAFDFRVATRYGSFKSSLSNTNIMKQREDNNSETSEGTVNGKGGTVTVDISYGSVKFLGE